MEEKFNYAELYLEATKLSRSNRQTIGEKNDYYITLEQLQNLIEWVIRNN